ncbi:MAG: fibronectin type III domain-containing protein [Rikenellaceae bacterium]|nr:fibronectin type III domain-containing protein [Rikenellaceae bacterium]
MKNLFKSLMLVAVAAMGFTSCQKEELPTQTGAEKFTIDVIANLEETRSAFGEKSGNAYPSYWYGGETVKAAILQSGTYPDFIDVVESKEATVAVSGTQTAQLTLEWDSMSQTYGTMLIAVPYGSVTFEAGNYYYDGDKPGFVVNVPTEQTPLENSVDPAAHILTATYEGSFSKTIMPEFVHAAAYGKMTLKNFNGKIDNVVVTIDTKSYVLNADNVTSNVFWFGCKANEDPETVKIAVNTTDEKSYTKTLDLTAGKGKGLPFSKGCVAEFGVDMDGIAAEEGAADVMMVDYTLDVAQYTSGYWQFSTGSHGTAPYVRIYMNDNDMADNAFKTGGYTFEQSNTNPNSGVFSINRYNIGSTVYGGSIYGGSMNISIVNGQYRIIITAGDVNPITFGWEGVPEGWNAPAGGGDVTPEPEPEEPTKTQLAQPTILTATATADTATITWTAVENASSYNVTVGTTTQNVPNPATTATFEGLVSDTTYNVSVVAVGDGTNYTDSTAATTTVKTSAASTGGDDESIPEGYSKCEFVSLTKGVYYGRAYNWMGDFVFNYDGATISFSMCDFNGAMQVDNKNIKPGEYVNNNNGANMDTKELYNISVSGMAGNSGSKVEVSKDGDVYTFLMTFITGARTYNLYYQGTL